VPKRRPRLADECHSLAFRTLLHPTATLRLERIAGEERELASQLIGALLLGMTMRHVDGISARSVLSVAAD
jgi:hypothetical protein